MTKVLIIDDSRFARNMLKGILEQVEGFEVIGTAENGEEGLKLARKLKPDIITLDLDMPIMDGPATLKSLREWSSTPVVVVSGTPPELASQMGLEDYEPVAFVTKQLSEKQLDLSLFTAELGRTLRQLIELGSKGY